MKLYMTPGSCSTGIHILLEECEVLFEAHIVNLLAGDNLTPQFLALNPRGSVPTLVRDDGTALLDFISIARWIAQTYPQRALLPAEPEPHARVMSVMDHAVNFIHGEGFTRVFVAERYTGSEGATGDVQRAGRALVSKGFAELEPLLTGPQYIADRFSIGDAALFYVEFWAERMNIPLPARCQAHYEAMLQRPAVRQVLAEEGYISTLQRHSPAHTRHG